MKDLAISVNLEASEILEIFQWIPENQKLSSSELEHLKYEMADTMIYLIYMFDKLNINPADAIREKIEINKKRHWDKTENGDSEKK